MSAFLKLIETDHTFGDAAALPLLLAVLECWDFSYEKLVEAAALPRFGGVGCWWILIEARPRGSASRGRSVPRHSIGTHRRRPEAELAVDGRWYGLRVHRREEYVWLDKKLGYWSE
ncbi:hypothetical protein SASPL_135279 [Salvia splendens]|uniref:Uncharacterized protein n=1 Tax=Salvia splendens TaxID=180675 RepID=A0A8X8ZFB3_SALSN|nr:hypothetical protein SASPL_135279 [Salvia splendens]